MVDYAGQGSNRDTETGFPLGQAAWRFIASGFRVITGRTALQTYWRRARLVPGAARNTACACVTSV
jgi:hypothetical protein